MTEKQVLQILQGPEKAGFKPRLGVIDLTSTNEFHKLTSAPHPSPLPRWGEGRVRGQSRVWKKNYRVRISKVCNILRPRPFSLRSILRFVDSHNVPAPSVPTGHENGGYEEGQRCSIRSSQRRHRSRRPPRALDHRR